MKNRLIFGLITAALLVFVTIMTVRSLSDTNTKGRDSKLEDIVFEGGKVNIYVFWGDGCPHCADLFEFLETAKDEYGKYFNLYKFEVWYNKENAKLLNDFSVILEDDSARLPYTIIGEKTFSGFGNTMKNTILNAIMDQVKNNFDVYGIFKTQ